MTVTELHGKAARHARIVAVLAERTVRSQVELASILANAAADNAAGDRKGAIAKLRVAIERAQIVAMLRLDDLAEVRFDERDAMLECAPTDTTSPSRMPGPMQLSEPM